MPELITSLQNPAVRDLAWSCFSSPLFKQLPVSEERPAYSAQFDLTAKRWEWLTALDADPTALNNHLQQANTHLLGTTFEALWAFFLSQDDATDLLAKNLQINNQQRTIGEFDFLYYCHEKKRHCQLETAVKLYLGIPNLDASNLNVRTTENRSLSEWSHWIGPGCKDRLDIKLNHMLDNQLQLDAHPEAKSALKSLGIEQLDRQYCLRGYLFYPQISEIRDPEYVATNHLRGTWLSFDELKGSADDSDKHWLILNKPQWLAPAVTRNTRKLLRYRPLVTKLEDIFGNFNQPKLVAEMSPNKDSWAESKRFFVTPKNWLARASECLEKKKLR